MRKKSKSKRCSSLEHQLFAFYWRRPIFSPLKWLGRKTEKDRDRGWKHLDCAPIWIWKRKCPLESEFQVLPNLVSAIPQIGTSPARSEDQVCPGVLLWTHTITGTCSHHLVWRNKKTKSATFSSGVSALWGPQPRPPALTPIFTLLILLLGCPQKMESGSFSVWGKTDSPFPTTQVSRSF